MIERKEVLRLRRQMPIMERHVCMNWGYSGPSPRPVLKAIQETLERESRFGPFHPEVKARRDALLDHARRLLGEVIGSGADEITLTDNTTAGVNLVAHILDWRRGDEVIISNAEHPGGYLPWFALRDRCGVKVHQIPIDGDDDHFVKALLSRINQKTRLICISHVAWLSGYRYPLREVAKIAKSRGVLFLVDGAQAAGALDFSVRDIKCDFYAYPGQKWLMGPQGTGAFYVRRDLRKKLPLPGAGYDSAEKKDLASGTYVPYPDGRRFELATKSTALFAGLAVGAEQALRLGLAAIEDRILSLAGRLSDQLREIPHLELLSFRPARGNPAHSGLVSFRIPSFPASEVVSSLLRQERILVREVPAYPPGVRVSLHYVNLEEEVDGVATAVGRLAAKAAHRKK
ncbi:MAG: aminotransferase class V-fold PLP-dependent enzyme [Nitrospinota bacterium]